ncbi:hypothetical protein AGMMS50229_09830 [Campylobacterota bacterium]|nr:hypothetical protein AGMMS50229_09830 [Campylobacterota bacterium]
MPFYLEFEKPIRALEEELDFAKIRNDEKAVSYYSREMESAIFGM